MYTNYRSKYNFFFNKINLKHKMFDVWYIFFLLDFHIASTPRRKYKKQLKGKANIEPCSANYDWWILLIVDSHGSIIYLSTRSFCFIQSQLNRRIFSYNLVIDFLYLQDCAECLGSLTRETEKQTIIFVWRNDCCNVVHI